MNIKTHISTNIYQHINPFNHLLSNLIPAYNVQVVETTGAGDSFLSGFLYCLVRDREGVLGSKAIADSSLAFASAAGALTCCKPGAIASQPYLDDIKSLMGTPFAISNLMQQ